MHVSTTGSVVGAKLGAVGETVGIGVVGAGVVVVVVVVVVVDKSGSNVEVVGVVDVVAVGALGEAEVVSALDVLDGVTVGVSDVVVVDVLDVVLVDCVVDDGGDVVVGVIVVDVLGAVEEGSVDEGSIGDGRTVTDVVVVSLGDSVVVGGLYVGSAPVGDTAILGAKVVVVTFNARIVGASAAVVPSSHAYNTTRTTTIMIKIIKIHSHSIVYLTALGASANFFNGGSVCAVWLPSAAMCFSFP